MNYTKLYNEYNDRFFGSILPMADIMEFDGSDPFTYVCLGINFAIDGLTVPDGDNWIIGLDHSLTNMDKKLTLIHEMIHVWQGETGLEMDHGRNFIRKCIDILEE